MSSLHTLILEQFTGVGNLDSVWTAQARGMNSLPDFGTFLRRHTQARLSVIICILYSCVHLESASTTGK